MRSSSGVPGLNTEKQKSDGYTVVVVVLVVRVVLVVGKVPVVNGIRARVRKGCVEQIASYRPES
jgi:hypothetical protein